MLKKNHFKSNVSAVFSELAPVCGWSLRLLYINEKGIRNSPLSAWQHVFSCPFTLHGRSSCPCATRVSEHDEILWNTAAPMSSWQSPAHFLHVVMKVILTLNSSGVANVVDTEWQADNAMCWTGYSLGMRCHTWSFTAIYLSVSEHNTISASGQMQISTEDTQEASCGKCGSKCNNSVRQLPGVNVCNWINVKQSTAGDKQHTGSANYSWMNNC